LSNEPDDELHAEKMDAAELAAAELIVQTKKIPADELALPIVDKACVWAVTVKKMRIREPEEPEP
jgi:hypothetical protein